MQDANAANKDSAPGSVAESQLLTCDQMRWKYFLRSGHWRIPGEEGLGSWKACKVNFIDDGKAEQSLSLQVAVQPPKDSQVHAVLATYKQTISTGPAPSGPLPKIATVGVMMLYM